MQNFKKFIIKHKGTLISAAAVAALLLFGLFLDFAKPNSNTDVPLNQSDVESGISYQSAVGSVDEDEETVSQNSTDTQTTSSKHTESQIVSSEKTTENENQVSATPETPSKPKNNETTVSEEKPTVKSYSCTISISCSTILNNIENCKANKVDIIPQDGWILKPLTVEFTEGETVFDVLQKTCRKNNIQMESSFNPIYNSAYIEGIANIYEFDVGQLSGWQYSVDGEFPNFGCSLYKLKDGQNIKWLYTCDMNDLKN